MNIFLKLFSKASYRVRSKAGTSTPKAVIRPNGLEDYSTNVAGLPMMHHGLSNSSSVQNYVNISKQKPNILKALFTDTFHRKRHRSIITRAVMRALQIVMPATMIAVKIKSKWMKN